MTTFDFAPLFRSTVGFDRMMRLLEDTRRLGEAGNGYPPYNIEKTGDDAYRITLAVAGFGEDDLTIEARENTLVVEGQKKETGGTVSVLYRGIAGRGFRRQFQLADHVKAVDAHLDNGMLVIDLVRELPEEMKPRRIPVTKGKAASIAGKTETLVEGEKAA